MLPAKRDTKINVEKIIKLLGGQTEVARLLDIKAPSVHEWIDANKIPEGRVIQLAALLEQRTGGKLSRKSLRPRDWQMIWPELAMFSDGKVTLEDLVNLCNRPEVQDQAVEL